MTEPHVYVTSNRTGTVHLITEREWAERTTGRTVCGQSYHRLTHQIGDESLSGHVATCGACRRIAGLG